MFFSKIQKKQSRADACRQAPIKPSHALFYIYILTSLICACMLHYYQQPTRSPLVIKSVRSAITEHPPQRISRKVTDNNQMNIWSPVLWFTDTLFTQIITIKFLYTAICIPHQLPSPRNLTVWSPSGLTFFKSTGIDLKQCLETCGVRGKYWVGTRVYYNATTAP